MYDEFSQQVRGKNTPERSARRVFFIVQLLIPPRSAKDGGPNISSVLKIKIDDNFGSQAPRKTDLYYVCDGSVAYALTFFP